MPNIAAGRVWLAIVTLSATGAPAFAAEATPAQAAAGSYEPAQACAACHPTIHTYWSESAHARAATSPVFQAGLAAAVAAAKDPQAARRACVWCHAPTALSSGDWELKQAITREGVSCDFCHTVAGVELSAAENPFALAPGKVKRGPLQYAQAPSHETEYSTLHKTSPLLCAACHEHANTLGVPVLSTYSEWKASPYPERGMICQECHMPLVPGRSAREGLAASDRRINLHRLMGGGAASKVSQALELRIESLDLGASAASVQVAVTNAGAGHAVPGGLSSKTVVLAAAVETASGALAHRAERSYRRVLKDAQGRELTSAADLFAKAASVGEDTRLLPKQSRSERFTLPLPPGARAIVVRLEYHDASNPLVAPTTTLVAEERRELPGR